MKQRDKQLQRLLYFVDELKKEKYPNASSFVKLLQRLDELNETNLACSTKTINRDLDYLKDEIGAPVEYDPTAKGYYLWMKEWTFPELALGRDQLFAELFTKKISENTLLPCLKEQLQSSVEIQMTAGESDGLDCSALGSVIHATGKTIAVDLSISEKILDAWKTCHQVKAFYKKRNEQEAEERLLEIHALFLSNSIWYCHAYCHKRQQFRSFAMHKFTEITVLKERFTRSKEVIESLKGGHYFDFPMAKDISVRCEASAADSIQDREWFETQSIKTLPNSQLEIHFDEAPRKALLWWVLSFGGELELIAPQELRDEVKKMAGKLLRSHE